eukprot:Nk52_evm31s1967 gene=Nk52_evmTU31s1967
MSDESSLSDPKEILPFIILAFALGIWVVYWLFFNSKLFGFIATAIVNYYLQKSGKKYSISVNSISFALLSGKIMFTSFQYIDEDLCLRAYDGYVIFRYWLLWYRKSPEDTSSFSRVTVHVSGLEYYLFNRAWLYEELLKRTREAEQRGGEEASIEEVIGTSDVEVKNTNGERSSLLDRIPLWRRTFPVVQILIYRGIIVFGNSFMHPIVSYHFDKASGWHSFAESKSKADCYKMITHFRVLYAQIKFSLNSAIENPKERKSTLMASYALPERSIGKKKNSYVAFESNVMKVHYYADVPGLHVADSKEDDPEWGVDVSFGRGTEFIYGPVANRHRDILQNFFFPSDYLDRVVDDKNIVGKPRLHRHFTFHALFEAQTTVRVMFADLYEVKDCIAEVRELKKPYQLTISAGEGSLIRGKFSLLTSDDGFSNVIENRFLNVNVTTSLKYSSLMNCETFQMRAAMVYPKVWNEEYHWCFDVILNDPQVHFIRAHVPFFLLLVKTWTSITEEMDVSYFVPFKWTMQVAMNSFELFLCVNEKNVINKPSDFQDNAYFILYGKSLDLALEYPSSTSYMNDKNEIIMQLGVTDLNVRLSFPATHSIPQCLDAPDAPYLSCGNLKLFLNFESYPEYSPNHLDILTLEIDAVQVAVKLFGFILRYILFLKENYFGEYNWFTSMDGYMKNQRPADVDEEENPMEVYLNLRIEDAAILLPPYAYVTLQEMPTLSVREISLELRNCPSYQDIYLALTPITLSASAGWDAELSTDEAKGQSSKNDPKTSAGSEVRDCLRIHGLILSGNRLYGPDALATTYASAFEIRIGAISGQISPSQIFYLSSWLKSFAFHFQDKDNALDFPEDGIDLMYTTVNLRTGCVNFFILSPDNISHILVEEGISLYLDTYVNEDYNDKIQLNLSNVVWKQMMVSSHDDMHRDHERKYGADKTTTVGGKSGIYWLEVANVHFSANVNIYKKLPDWQAAAAKQKAFLVEFDSSTKRLEFIYDDDGEEKESEESVDDADDLSMRSRSNNTRSSLGGFTTTTPSRRPSSLRKLSRRLSLSLTFGQESIVERPSASSIVGEMNEDFDSYRDDGAFRDARRRSSKASGGTEFYSAQSSIQGSVESDDDDFFAARDTLDDISEKENVLEDNEGSEIDTYDDEDEIKNVVERLVAERHAIPKIYSRHLRLYNLTRTYTLCSVFGKTTLPTPELYFVLKDEEDDGSEAKKGCCSSICICAELIAPEIRRLESDERESCRVRFARSRRLFDNYRKQKPIPKKVIGEPTDIILVDARETIDLFVTPLFFRSARNLIDSVSTMVLPSLDQLLDEIQLSFTSEVIKPHKEMFDSTTLLISVAGIRLRALQDLSNDALVNTGINIGNVDICLSILSEMVPCVQRKNVNVDEDFIVVDTFATEAVTNTFNMRKKMKEISGSASIENIDVGVRAVDDKSQSSIRKRIQFRTFNRLQSYRERQIYDHGILGHERQILEFRMGALTLSGVFESDVKAVAFCKVSPMHLNFGSGSVEFLIACGFSVINDIQLMAGAIDRFTVTKRRRMQRLVHCLGNSSGTIPEKWMLPDRFYDEWRSTAYKLHEDLNWRLIMHLRTCLHFLKQGERNLIANELFEDYGGDKWLTGSVALDVIKSFSVWYYHQSDDRNLESLTILADLFGWALRENGVDLSVKKTCVALEASIVLERISIRLFDADIRRSMGTLNSSLKLNSIAFQTRSQIEFTTRLPKISTHSNLNFSDGVTPGLNSRVNSKIEVNFLLHIGDIVQTFNPGILKFVDNLFRYLDNIRAKASKKLKAVDYFENNSRDFFADEEFTRKRYGSLPQCWSDDDIGLIRRHDMGLSRSKSMPCLRTLYDYSDGNPIKNTLDSELELLIFREQIRKGESDFFGPKQISSENSEQEVSPKVLSETVPANVDLPQNTSEFSFHGICFVDKIRFRNVARHVEFEVCIEQLSLAFCAVDVSQKKASDSLKSAIVGLKRLIIFAGERSSSGSSGEMLKNVFNITSRDVSVYWSQTEGVRSNSNYVPEPDNVMEEQRSPSSTDVQHESSGRIVVNCNLEVSLEHSLAKLLPLVEHWASAANRQKIFLPSPRTVSEVDKSEAGTFPFPSVNVHVLVRTVDIHIAIIPSVSFQLSASNIKVVLHDSENEGVFKELGVAVPGILLRLKTSFVPVPECEPQTETESTIKLVLPKLDVSGKLIEVGPGDPLGSLGNGKVVLVSKLSKLDVNLSPNDLNHFVFAANLAVAEVKNIKSLFAEFLSLRSSTSTSASPPKDAKQTLILDASGLIEDISISSDCPDCSFVFFVDRIVLCADNWRKVDEMKTKSGSGGLFMSWSISFAVNFLFLRSRKTARFSNSSDSFASLRADIQLRNKVSSETLSAILISVQDIRVVFRPVAFDKAVLYFLHYKNAFTFWQMQKRLKSEEIQKSKVLYFSRRSQKLHAMTSHSSGNFDFFQQPLFTNTLFQIGVSRFAIAFPYTWSDKSLKKTPALVVYLKDMSVAADRHNAFVGSFASLVLHFVGAFDSRDPKSFVPEISRSLNYASIPKGTLRFCMRTVITTKSVGTGENRNIFKMISASQLIISGLVVNITGEIGKFVSELTKTIPSGDFVNAFDLGEENGEEEKRECPPHLSRQSSGYGLIQRKTSIEISNARRGRRSSLSTISIGTGTTPGSRLINAIRTACFEIDLSIKLHQGKCTLVTSQEEEVKDKPPSLFDFLPSDKIKFQAEKEVKDSDKSDSDGIKDTVLLIPAVQAKVNYFKEVEENMFSSGEDSTVKVDRLYCQLSVKSLPKEVCLKPSILTFLDEVMSGMRDTRGRVESRLKMRKESEPKTNSNGVENAMDALEKATMDFIFVFEIEPSSFEVSCLPESLVACRLGLPALKLCLSSTKSDANGVGNKITSLSLILSVFTFTLAHPYSPSPCLDIKFQETQIALSRSSEMKGMKTSRVVSALFDINSIALSYNIRQIDEILAFEMAWLSTGVFWKLIFGSEYGANMHQGVNEYGATLLNRNELLSVQNPNFESDIGVEEEAESDYEVVDIVSESAFQDKNEAENDGPSILYMFRIQNISITTNVGQTIGKTDLTFENIALGGKTEFELDKDFSVRFSIDAIKLDSEKGLVNGDICAYDIGFIGTRESKGKPLGDDKICSSSYTLWLGVVRSHIKYHLGTILVCDISRINVNVNNVAFVSKMSGVDCKWTLYVKVHAHHGKFIISRESVSSFKTIFKRLSRLANEQQTKISGLSSFKSTKKRPDLSKKMISQTQKEGNSKALIDGEIFISGDNVSFAAFPSNFTDSDWVFFAVKAFKVHFTQEVDHERKKADRKVVISMGYGAEEKASIMLKKMSSTEKSIIAREKMAGVDWLSFVSKAPNESDIFRFPPLTMTFEGEELFELDPAKVACKFVTVFESSIGVSLDVSLYFFLRDTVKGFVKETENQQYSRMVGGQANAGLKKLGSAFKEYSIAPSSVENKKKKAASEAAAAMLRLAEIGGSNTSLDSPEAELDSFEIDSLAGEKMGLTKSQSRRPVVGEKSTLSREASGGLAIEKEREFHCDVFVLQPELKLVSYAGNFTPPDLEWILLKLGFKNARSTIPRWLHIIAIDALEDTLDSVSSIVKVQANENFKRMDGSHKDTSTKKT